MNKTSQAFSYHPSTFRGASRGGALRSRAAEMLLMLAGAALLWLGAGAIGGAAAAATLDGISYSALPGDRVQVKLDLSAPVAKPLNFTIDNPARVALDFPGVQLNLKHRTEAIGVGMARSVTAVEAQGRTRVVLNLITLVPYSIKVRGSAVFVTLDSAQAAGTAALTPAAGHAKSTSARSIKNVDFRRGESGEGRVIVTLSDPSTVVNMHEEGHKVIVDFSNTSLPQQLQRRLDVTDFATPVKSVATFAQGNNVRMVIAATGEFQDMAYQSDNLLTIDLKPMTKEQAEEAKKKKFGYTGQRLSLNFQNIEVRSVLQLIADFTGFNLVASDSVTGNITLRLKNVPWDQALDIILKSKGLAMRQDGNVIMVAPAQELAAREKLQLESEKQVAELAPLHTEFMQVNYAKASDIATLLKAEKNSLLSKRGNVSVDARTNTLLVRDTSDNLQNIRKLVAKLDVPVRQVLIESRIVVADDEFTRDLGVRFGVSGSAGSGTKTVGKAGGTIVGSNATGYSVPGTTAFSSNGNENFLVDLPVTNPAGALGFAIGKVGTALLQLELSALQAEGRGEVLSNPRVITSNQKEAVIEQGTEIPYQEASSSGATSVSFKKAVLSLKVTPQITPDDRIIMDLQVNKDSVGQTFAGVPSIDTRAINTQVLVDNGETIVLGGIYEQTTRNDATKVPGFGDLPIFGYLFRNTKEQNNRNELLIFVTPKIIKQTLATNE